MSVLNFDNFLNERWVEDKPKPKKFAVGIAAIYDNKILLIHPTNSSWQKSTCGIPKGGLEEGEDHLDGAIREFMEEVGIQLSRDQVDPEPHKTDFYNSKNQVTGHLIYYVCRISDLSEIGLSDLTVPKSQLQIEEVDWAKFVGPHDAYPIINRSQMIILDRHLSLDK